MRVMPTSARERVSLVVLPFKAYTVVGSLLFYLWSALFPHLRNDALAITLTGYLLTAVVLTVAAMVLAITGPRGMAISTMMFAGAAFLIYWWVLPAIMS